ncbi:MAG: DUF6580 family putative transport protein [Gammaproteobacteria bacterium]
MFRNFIFLVIMLIISRFIGLPPNFSPLLATAIFMPRLTNSKYLQSFIPVLALILSNFFLEAVNLVIFSTIIFVFSFAPILSRKINNLFYSCLSVMLCWFILVNGSVWMISGGSIINTYLGAVPFDLKFLISTLLYLTLFHYFDLIYREFYGSNIKLIDRVIKQ